MRMVRVTGWGRLPEVLGELREPSSAEELNEDWGKPQARISRGLGRSYGDASLPVPGGFALGYNSFGRILSFDETSGILRAEAGVSLDEVIRRFLPRGWFPAVVPGTKYVTLGGATAADIHGKNHHVDGTFGTHVISLELLLPDGREVLCSRLENADLFRATIGGMGLTGNILRITVLLRRVSSSWCKVRTIKGQSLEHTLSLLADNDRFYRHTVAWMDCLASGRRLGRGVLMLGNEAEPHELPSGVRESPFRVPSRIGLRVPFDLPSWLLGPQTVGLFNDAYYGLARENERLVSFEGFFFPLDAIRDWNRIYGRRGFAQFQVHFPDATAGAGLSACLELVSGVRQASFLAVLKRSGPANGFPLSFLDVGYTLALDLPGPAESIKPLMNRLDEVLMQHGGKVYFAKDAFVSPELIPSMYPGLKEFRRIQRLVDPNGLMRSMLSDRLRIHE